LDSKEYFDQVAEEWDTMRQGFFSETVRDKAMGVCGVKAGAVAADIGAGTGFMTEGLAARGCRVIAIDQSEAMLNQMKLRLAKYEDIEYRLGESETLPIDNQAVDYVFANMVLHHVESPAKAIKEMVRILKPGGKLGLTDLDQHKFEFLKIEHHDRWMGFCRDDVKAWLTEAGLRNVAVDCVGQNCCAESCCNGEKAAISIFVAWGER
jgi:ubiquinone/menaquinone biosynthesis C-methylase UbiE